MPEEAAEEIQFKINLQLDQQDISDINQQDLGEENSCHTHQNGNKQLLILIDEYVINDQLSKERNRQSEELQEKRCQQNLDDHFL